jgi:hypothetical protein
MDLTIYSEILILIDVLLGDVLGDHLIGDVSGTAAEISSRPQVSAPELLLQMRKFRQQMVRRLPFQPLQQPADRHLGWHRHHQVHMVLGYVPLHNLDVMLSTDVPDQIPNPRGYLAAQSWSPIFRNPNQMQMNLENGVRPASVFWHHPSLSRGAPAEAVA